MGLIGGIRRYFHYSSPTISSLNFWEDEVCLCEYTNKQCIHRLHSIASSNNLQRESRLRRCLRPLTRTFMLGLNDLCRRLIR